MTDLKVLIVEDEEILLEFMAQKITAEGYVAYTSNSGESGLPMAQRLKPDIIVTDLDLPGMDGREFINAYLKGLQKHEYPGIIVVSGIMETMESVRSVFFKVDHFLKKPCGMGDILNAINTLAIRNQRHKLKNLKETKEHRHILIIDDDEGDRNLMKNALESAGYQNISFASHGSEGMIKVKLEKPEVVVIDTVLPDINGMDLCKCIRDIHGLQTYPIVITGSVEAIDVEGVRAAGGFDSVVKTPDYGFLLEAIEKVGQ